MTFSNYAALVGKRTKTNILDHKGLLLIAENTILTQSHIDKLEKFNIELSEVEIELEPLPDSMLPNTQSEMEQMYATALVKKTEERLEDIAQYVRENGAIPVAELEAQVLPIIQEAASKRNLFQLFTDLKSMADFRYKQSIGVVVISAQLGKWLGLDEEEMSLLATAASLYDIGSVKLPSDLLNKPERFTHTEMEIMKEHTKFGYEMLLESDVDPRVALVAWQHHEREDGSGYPRQLKGDEIDRLSKIIALADVYVAMTSERPHRKALPFYEVIQEIHRQIVRGKFDSAIGLTFLNGLMSAQIGKEVLMSDNRRGKILLVNPNYPTRPFISLDGEYIDLSKDDTLEIVEIVG